MLKRREKGSQDGIKREALLKVLSAVKPGLAKEEFIEQASHFVFSKKRVTTYNDYICVSHPLDTGLSCSVSAEKFYKLVKGMPNEAIRIQMDGEKFTIKSKSVRATLAVVADAGIAKYIDELQQPFEDAKWFSLPEDFVQGISACLFSVSKDISRGALASVCVKPPYIYSSDGLRISRYEMAKSMKGSFLIPMTPAKELVSYNLTSYFETENWLNFKTVDGATFSCRKLVGDFPDCEPHLKVKGLSVKLPGDLLPVIENIAIFTEEADEIDKMVSLEFEPGILTCSAQDSTGWIERDSKIDYKGKKLKLQVHPMFFQQALGKAANVTIGETTALFSAGKFMHVMALPKTKTKE